MTKSMVNNYVKVGLIPRPVGKKYDREHLAMLLMICVLKQALSMESISQILLALCEEGVQAGYGRFCAITRKIEESARGGHIELFDRNQIDAQEMALRSGVMAGAVHHPHMQAAGKLPGMKKVYIDISIEQGICQRT